MWKFETILPSVLPVDEDGNVYTLKSNDESSFSYSKITSVPEWVMAKVK